MGKTIERAKKQRQTDLTLGKVAKKVADNPGTFIGEVAASPTDSHTIEKLAKIIVELLDRVETLEEDVLGLKEKGKE